MDVSSAITIAISILGFILILGFIGNYIFNRTQVPSIVWLLIFGLIVGFIFNIKVIDSGLIDYISGFFSSVAIVIILFDGGINIDLHQLFRGAPRGLLLTVTGFCLSILATMGIMIGLSVSNVLNIDVQTSVIIGIVLGAIIGGTSSPIVIPLASRLTNLENRTKMILSIESILTDPLAIVVFLALFFMIKSGEPDIGVGVIRLVSTFSVGTVVGIATGGIWLPIMHHIRKEQFSYVVTLAIAFLMFSLTDSWWNGAGAISCLMFGLVLGNGKKILKMVDYHGKGFEMDDQTKQYHALISFVMRTFFFVFLGMMVTYQEVKIEFIIIGIIILLALLGLRYLAVMITTLKGNFERDDRQSMSVMMPRGLAAAILAITYGPKLVESSLPSLSGFYEGIVFVIILGTAIICTTGVSLICHRQHKPIEKRETSIDLKEEIDLMSKKEK